MKNVRRALRGALILAVFAVPLIAAPAGAQAPQCPVPGTYPPRTTDLQMDRTVVERGAPVNVASCGWQPGSTVTVTLESHPILLGTVVADANGTWRATFTIPTHAHLGEHNIVARGFDRNGNPLVLRAAVRIIDPITTAAVARPAGRTTPRTGADVAPWLILAVAVLGAGLVLLKIGRRNKGDVPA